MLCGKLTTSEGVKSGEDIQAARTIPLDVHSRAPRLGGASFSVQGRLGIGEEEEESEQGRDENGRRGMGGMPYPLAPKRGSWRCREVLFLMRLGAVSC